MSVETLPIATRISEALVSMQRWAKMTVMVVTDCLALPVCFLIAMVLRLGDIELTKSYGITAYIAVGVITTLVLAASGIYRAVIRYIDQHLLTAAGVGLAIAIVAAYALSILLNEQRLPGTALAIYWFIAFSYVVTSRLTVRNFLRSHMLAHRHQQTAVAIFGAGDAGAQLAQAIKVSNKYRALCFFDDKLSLSNQNVAGLKVIHTSKLHATASQLGIELLVLAIPSAAAQRRREVMHLAHEAGLEVKTLYSLLELADEKISAQSIRPIKIEDLLGRAPVPPKEKLFDKCLRKKNVLVTGAGGSIGSELCRQITSAAPSNLHLLDHSEFALYSITQELELAHPSISIHAHLGSVCDGALLERIVRDGEIDTIYHAAAYKHVPLLEANMAEGVRNNVIGAQVVALTAERFNIPTCVLVSTDKAVRPTNIMGASKRVAELIFQAAAAKPSVSTTFCMVRFGNVLGSSGSVVPLFQKQIERGGPVTVTHPEVTRYFMLIQEAAQLVIQAGAMAHGGEVFVLDMGDPVKIVDLARTMIDMAGLQEKNEQNPNGDIEIRYVGLRPGEKLYEELLIGEDVAPSEHPRVMRSMEYALPHAVLTRQIEMLLNACRMNDTEQVKAMMQNIVGEYSPQPTREAPARQQPMSVLSREAPSPINYLENARILAPASQQTL